MILRTFLLMVLVCGAFAAHAQTVQFFSAFQDIPLMPGLTELGEQGVVYDKPGGRFAETLADTGAQSAEQVMAYYEAAMPEFGWKKIGPGLYSRENERLSLAFELFEGREVLRLSLSPL
jgi:hypothetical protein